MEKSVLIVDDEERVVQSIAGVLEDEGFRVTIAKNGEEAIDLFQSEEPDVTLLDIWMPGMDGIEVLKRLKGISPECLVIMISGHATISTAMAAVKFGAFDFIEKPLSLDLLLLTIHRALDRQKEFSGIQAAGEAGTPEISCKREGPFFEGDSGRIHRYLPDASRRLHRGERLRRRTRPPLPSADLETKHGPLRNRAPFRHEDRTSSATPPAEQRHPLREHLL